MSNIIRIRNLDNEPNVNGELIFPVDYSGNTTDASHNTFGIFIRYGLLRPENGGIINISRMAGHHFKH